MKRKRANENEEDVRAAPKRSKTRQVEVWPHPRRAGDGQGGGVQPGINGRVGEGEENQAERPFDTLPFDGTTAQTKKVKHEIREGYAWLFGEVPLAPVEASRAKKSEGAQYESDSITDLTATIPTDLRQQVALGCVRRGLSLDEGVRAALESHFPPAADTLPPDVVAAE